MTLHDQKLLRVRERIPAYARGELTTEQQYQFACELQALAVSIERRLDGAAEDREAP